MKLILVVMALCITLVSCSDNVRGADVEKALELCKDHGGLDGIDINGWTTSTAPIAYCKDGTSRQRWMMPTDPNPILMFFVVLMGLLAAVAVVGYTVGVITWVVNKLRGWMR